MGEGGKGGLHGMPPGGGQGSSADKHGDAALCRRMKPNRDSGRVRGFRAAVELGPAATLASRHTTGPQTCLLIMNGSRDDLEYHNSGICGYFSVLYVGFEVVFAMLRFSNYRISAPPLGSRRVPARGPGTSTR